MLLNTNCRAYLALMATGLFQTADGWAQVNYGAHTAPIPRARYEESGYQPPFETLPLEADYRAAQRKAEDRANGA